MRRKFSSSKLEWIYIGQLLEAIPDKMIENMIENALIWYIIKAKQYKALEILINIITIISPTAIVLINSYMIESSVEGQAFVALAGTVAASAKALSKIHEKRIRYRRAAEQIKYETERYISGVGEYALPNRNVTFSEKLIEIRQLENNEWVKNEKGEKPTAVKTELGISEHNE